MSRGAAHSGPLPNPLLAPLSVDNLSSGYAGKRIVEKASFECAAGSLTAIIGANGSGKSTLLATIARLIRPDAGAVLLHGRSIHQMPTREAARQLGILPQSPVIPESMSVFDLVSRGRYPHQGLLNQWTQKDTEAVEKALRLTGTRDFATMPVDRLSGGQRQRCWIAMALAQETNVILLDEPTTYLDMKFQVEVMNLLHELAATHTRTIITVLHDLNLAIAYADQLIFMRKGRIHTRLSDPAECTSDLIRSVFDADVRLVRASQDERPFFMPNTPVKARTGK